MAETTGWQRVKDHLSENLFNYGFNTQQSGQEADYSLGNTLGIAFGPTQALGAGTDEGFASSQTDTTGVYPTTTTTSTPPSTTTNNYTTSGTSENLLMPDPSQPSFNEIYGDAFKSAFAAVDKLEASIKGGYDADVASLEAGTEQRKTGISNELDSRMANFGQQRGEAQQQTGSVIEQARRQASELMQGIQARYGGTTGTGRFTSEILGSQATRNISQNQAALQNTMGKINQAENELKTTVTTLLNNEDTNLQTNKINLRAALNKALADVSATRAMLETEKADKKYQILNDYQNQLNAITQYNLEYKRGLAQEVQKAQSALDQLRAKTQYQADIVLNPANLKQLIDSGVYSPQQAQQLTLGQSMTGGNLGSLVGQTTGSDTSSGLEMDPNLADALGI